MKKVLSIVLALAMVLCMIPMMAADEAKMTITDGSYILSLIQTQNTKVNAAAEDFAYIPGTKATINKVNSSVGNSITADFWYDSDDAIGTGKWTEDKVMALVGVSGFQFNATDKDIKVTVDGADLDISKNAEYVQYCGAKAGYKTIVFPVELVKGGISDTYVVTASWTRKVGDLNVKYTETAKISVKVNDKAEAAKATKTAYITNIAKDADEKEVVSVYIVGSKIYADFANDYASNFALDITFADENKAAFTGITYVEKTGANIEIAKETTFVGEDTPVEKLTKSVGDFNVDVEKDPTAIQFKLQTEAANYKVDKKYTLVCRVGIREADPKGIYLDQSAVTIAVGEEYTPVIKAAADGRTLTPSHTYIKGTTDVIDWVGNVNTAKIIGTKPGVAYICADYTNNYKTFEKVLSTKIDWNYSWKKGWYPTASIVEEVNKGLDASDFYYTSSMQKVTVVAGTTVPATTTEYTVTCRNLNVRKGAGTSFAKAGMAHRGDKLAVVEIANGWAKLADGTYVCAKYITK